MQPVLERGSIDKPLTFDIGLIQLSFIPVCSATFQSNCAEGLLFINPRRACARVTVLVLSVCLSVCVSVCLSAVADLENEKGWFQFIVALARLKIFVGHAHFGSREDTYLSHDSASKLPLTLSARDVYIYAQKSPTLPRGMHTYIIESIDSKSRDERDFH